MEEALLPKALSGAEVIETLKQGFENTAVCRREAVQDYPIDERNLEAAALLDLLAASVERINPSVRATYQKLFAEATDAFNPSEMQHDFLRRVGFSCWPLSAEEFCRDLINEHIRRARLMAGWTSGRSRV